MVLPKPHFDKHYSLKIRAKPSNRYRFDLIKKLITALILETIYQKNGYDRLDE